jgi:hypothetical protein
MFRDATQQVWCGSPNAFIGAKQGHLSVLANPTRQSLEQGPLQRLFIKGQAMEKAQAQECAHAGRKKKGGSRRTRIKSTLTCQEETSKKKPTIARNNPSNKKHGVLPYNMSFGPSRRNLNPLFMFFVKSHTDDSVCCSFVHSCVQCI